MHYIQIQSVLFTFYITHDYITRDRYSVIALFSRRNDTETEHNIWINLNLFNLLYFLQVSNPLQLIHYKLHLITVMHTQFDMPLKNAIVT